MCRRVVRKEESQRRARLRVALFAWRGRLMLGSVHARTILLAARSSVVRAYSSWPRKFRLVPFVVIAILLFPLIASPAGQAALAQISSGQTYPAQTYPSQTYPAQTYPAQTYPGQTYPAQTN